MREIQMSPKRSEKLMEQKREKRIAAREEKREERNLLKKGKMHQIKNKRIVEKKKKEVKSSMQVQAEDLRRQAAHGEINTQRTEDPKDDFYFQDTPLNVCNICSRILDSKNGKESHVKDTSSHDDYEIPCTSKDRCGGLFLNTHDLAVHRGVTGH